jgi:hypothetical protein
MRRRQKNLFRGAVKLIWVVKIGKAIAWLIEGLQQGLFPELEECWRTSLTDKDQQFVSIPESAQIGAFAPRSASDQWFGKEAA